jgi:hypothetical protein
MTKTTLLKTAVAAACLLAGGAALADGTAMFGSDPSIGAAPSYTISTAQGGLIYGYNSCFGGATACGNGGDDWHYYYSTPDWYVAGFDEFGLMNGTYGAPATPGSYYGILMTAPNAVGATAAPTLNVSDAKTVLVKMANFCGPVGCPGTANVLTVVLSNGKNTLTAYTDPHWDATATAVCSSSVTLAGQGDGAGPAPGTTTRLHSMYTYKVNLNTFKCSKGTLSKALSGLSAVSVEVRQDKNATAMANDVANHGDALQMVAVSRVSFGK